MLRLTEHVNVPSCNTCRVTMSPTLPSTLQKLDANDTEQERAAAIFNGINSLQDATKSGDVRASKQSYVAVVSAVQDWASSTGLAANLKGL